METAQTAGYALEMLDVLEMEDGLGITELAARLDVSRSVAQRVLVSLHQRAMITRSDDGRYWLGPMLIRLAAHLPHPLADIARCPVEKLGETTGETIVLAVPSGDDATVVAARPGRAGQLRVEYEVGFSHSLVRGASGLAILAFMDECTRDRVADKGMRDELERVRHAGYARTTGQLRGFMEGLAVPLRCRGEVLGSLAIIAPTSRGALLDGHLPALRAAAADIEARSDSALTSTSARSSEVHA